VLGGLLVLAVVGSFLPLPPGRRSLLFLCLFLTPVLSHLPGYGVCLRGLGFFVRGVVVALEGPAPLVYTRSWSSGCAHQSVGLPRSSFRLGALSVVLEVHTLVGMVGLLA